MDKKHTLVLLLLLIVLSLVFLIKLSSGSNEIDRLDVVLRPVKEVLSNDSKISLITNQTNYDQVYFQTQFILVPNIVERAGIINDTVLVIEKKNTKKIAFDRADYKILCVNSDKEFTVFLCAKK